MMNEPLFFRITSYTDAIAAFAAASGQDRPLALISPQTVLYAQGAAWFLSLCHQAATHFPQVPCTMIVDCADAAGYALAALDAGAPALALNAMPAPARQRLQDIARQMGRTVYTDPLPL